MSIPTPLRVFPFFLALMPFSALQAQVVSIEAWQGGKAGAVSMTFDDSLAGHWSYADPIMAANGVRGTFFVITGSTNWNSARTAALNGHEIGSHSTVDATLKNDVNADLKMQQSHDAIETEIGSVIADYQCHSIAWPYGFRRLDVVNDPNYKDLYVSARLAGSGSTYNPKDTTTWWKYGEGTYGLDHYFVREDYLMLSSTTITQFESQLDTVESVEGWTAFTYHGIETGGYQNISAANFTAQVEALAARKDTTLWVAPYGEVARYIRQRDNASASLVSNDGSTVTLSLTDTLDDTVFNLPLTLSFPAPAGWTSVTASQNGSAIPVSLREGTVYVDAVPDAGSIEVTVGSEGGDGPGAPVLGGIVASGSDLELSFLGENGVSYQLQRATVALDVLTETDWVDLENPEASAVGNGLPVTLSDPGAKDSFDAAWYRVVAE
jgi:hypothetical protein